MICRYRPSTSSRCLGCFYALLQPRRPVQTLRSAGNTPILLPSSCDEFPPPAISPKSNPNLFPDPVHRRMSSAAFSGLPMVINCQTHNHLRHYLDRALQILNPEIVGGLNLLPSACAMGTVAMSSTQKIAQCHRSYTWTTSSREPYTLARPYQTNLPTAFSPSHAKSSLHDDLAYANDRSGLAVKWRVEEGTIYLGCDLILDALLKGLPVIKLG